MGQTQQTQQQAQTQADYDISQAYENFRQSQRAVMNTASMAEGTKERSQATLESQFAGAESQIRANMASTVASAYQKNLETYQKGVEQATKEADTRADLKGQIDEWFANIAAEKGYFTYNEGEDYYNKYMKEDMADERLAGLTAARFGDPTVMDRLAEEDPDLYYQYMSNRSWVDPEMFDMENLSDMDSYSFENSPALMSKVETLKEEATALGLPSYNLEGKTAKEQIDIITKDIDYTKHKNKVEKDLNNSKLSYVSDNMNIDTRFHFPDLVHITSNSLRKANSLIDAKMPSDIRLSIANALDNNILKSGDVLQYNNSYIAVNTDGTVTVYRR